MNLDDPEWVDEKLFGEVFDDLIVFICPLCGSQVQSLDPCDNCHQYPQQPF